MYEFINPSKASDSIFCDLNDMYAPCPVCRTRSPCEYHMGFGTPVLLHCEKCGTLHIGMEWGEDSVQPDYALYWNGYPYEAFPEALPLRKKYESLNEDSTLEESRKVLSDLLNCYYGHVFGPEMSLNYIDEYFFVLESLCKKDKNNRGNYLKEIVRHTLVFLCMGYDNDALEHLKSVKKYIDDGDDETRLYFHYFLSYCYLGNSQYKMAHQTLDKALIAYESLVGNGIYENDPYLHINILELKRKAAILQTSNKDRDMDHPWKQIFEERLALVNKGKFTEKRLSELIEALTFAYCNAPKKSSLEEGFDRIMDCLESEPDLEESIPTAVTLFYTNILICDKVSKSRKKNNIQKAISVLESSGQDYSGEIEKLKSLIAKQDPLDHIQRMLERQFGPFNNPVPREEPVLSPDIIKNRCKDIHVKGSGDAVGFTLPVTNVFKVLLPYFDYPSHKCRCPKCDAVCRISRKNDYQIVCPKCGVHRGTKPLDNDDVIEPLDVSGKPYDGSKQRLALWNRLQGLVSGNAPQEETLRAWVDLINEQDNTNLNRLRYRFECSVVLPMLEPFCEDNEEFRRAFVHHSLCYAITFVYTGQVVEIEKLLSKIEKYVGDDENLDVANYHILKGYCLMYYEKYGESEKELEAGLKTVNNLFVKDVPEDDPFIRLRVLDMIYLLRRVTGSAKEDCIIALKDTIEERLDIVSNPDFTYNHLFDLNCMLREYLSVSRDISQYDTYFKQFLAKIKHAEEDMLFEVFLTYAYLYTHAEWYGNLGKHDLKLARDINAVCSKSGMGNRFGLEHLKSFSRGKVPEKEKLGTYEQFIEDYGF